MTTAPDLFARYLDDIEVGDSFTTKGRTITEADIVNFAALTWDTWNVVHPTERLKAGSDAYARALRDVYASPAEG